MLRFTAGLGMLLIACGLLLATACNKSSSADSTDVPKVEMPSAAEMRELASSSNAFAFDFWARAKDKPGNLAASPASITSALAMTWLGARGATADQMREVLHFQGDADGVARRWGRLALGLQNPSRKLKLRVANRLFGEKSFDFQKPFLEKTQSAFAAPLEVLDFKKSPEPSRAKINDWVEKQTERRIKQLLPDRSIDPDTRLVLVNAIYFLAEWATPFEHSATQPAPFKAAANNERTVPTMQLLHGFRAAEVDGVKLLELPYVGGEAAMLVVLPNELDGLAKLEAEFSVAKLAALSAALTSRNVDVALPRFTIDPTSSLSLKETLVKMGMPLAFDGKQADLSGIGTPPEPGRRLCVGDVFHKAFVKVDEKGTEASAGTAVVVKLGAGAPSDEFVFHADHPFLFLIVDNPSGLILFMGRVADPSVQA